MHTRTNNKKLSLVFQTNSKIQQDGRTIGKKATHAQKEQKKIHEKNEKKEVSKP